MTKLALFTSSIRKIEAPNYVVKIVSETPFRTEALVIYTEDDTSDNSLVRYYYPIDWWAVEQNGKIHVCSNYHKTSVIVKNILDVVTFIEDTIKRKTEKEQASRNVLGVALADKNSLLIYTISKEDQALVNVPSFDLNHKKKVLASLGYTPTKIKLDTEVSGIIML